MRQLPDLSVGMVRTGFMIVVRNSDILKKFPSEEGKHYCTVPRADPDGEVFFLSANGQKNFFSEDRNGNWCVRFNPKHYEHVNFFGLTEAEFNPSSQLIRIVGLKAPLMNRRIKENSVLNKIAPTSPLPRQAIEIPIAVPLSLGCLKSKLDELNSLAETHQVEFYIDSGKIRARI